MRAATGLLLLLPLTGCTVDEPTDEPVDDTSRYVADRSAETFDRDFRDDYEATAVLADGRRVRLWYSRDGDALREQHWSPDEQAWTEPRDVVTSGEPHPCQGIDVVAAGGTVAVIADFGLYCYDGEPPQESVAAVASGDLTEWEVDVTEGFDGWYSATVEDDGVRWRGPDGAALVWDPDGGFLGNRG